MKTKNISRLLLTGVILNSLNLNSFASILSEDGRYETFEGNNITIDNILEEDKVDVEIEGNTLVNLVDNIKYEGSDFNAKTFTSLNNSFKESVKKSTSRIQVKQNTVITIMLIIAVIFS